MAKNSPVNPTSNVRLAQNIANQEQFRQDIKQQLIDKVAKNNWKTNT